MDILSYLFGSNGNMRQGAAQSRFPPMPRPSERESVLNQMAFNKSRGPIEGTPQRQYKVGPNDTAMVLPSAPAPQAMAMGGPKTADLIAALTGGPPTDQQALNSAGYRRPPPVPPGLPGPLQPMDQQMYNSGYRMPPGGDLGPPSVPPAPAPVGQREMAQAGYRLPFPNPMGLPPELQPPQAPEQGLGEKVYNSTGGQMVRKAWDSLVGSDPAPAQDRPFDTVPPPPMQGPNPQLPAGMTMETAPGETQGPENEVQGPWPKQVKKKGGGKKSPNAGKAGGEMFGPELPANGSEAPDWMGNGSIYRDPSGKQYFIPKGGDQMRLISPPQTGDASGSMVPPIEFKNPFAGIAKMFGFGG